MKFRPAVLVAVMYSAVVCSAFSVSVAAQDRADEQIKTEKTCFDPDDVQNFKYQKRNSMVVTTRRKESYLLTLSGICPDLDSANGIGFTDVFAGDICSNTKASIVYNGMSFGPQKCRIANVQPAPAE